MLVFMDENQSVCQWAIVLDGADDPPVVARRMGVADVTWQLASTSVADFLRASAWDFSRVLDRAYCVWGWKQASILPHLSRFRDAFRELPRTYVWPMPATFRFSTSDGTQRILVMEWMDSELKAGADWYLAGSSPNDLRRLIDKMWDWGMVDVILNLGARRRWGSLRSCSGRPEGDL